MAFVAGCATTQARRPESGAANDLAGRVTELQIQIQAKDQEIKDLKLQLEGMKNSLQKSTNFAAQESRGQSSLVQVPGVTVKDLQKALVRAGFDPGPADGKIGRKTRKALKEFQKKNHLKADGVVGEKTWVLLKS